ncbi:MAG: MFS transporter [Anaerolineae bacterium]|nr:MFS transporter [Anaerolineae bacterium]
MQKTSSEHLARRMVLISGFAAFVIFGIRLSFSVFFAEFIMTEGWSNESAASIFSISMLVFAFGSTPGGILLDRFGPRVVFTSGVLLLALGLLLSSQARSITQLAIAYGIVGGSGLAIVGLGPLAANISAWVPPARRGRAIGVAFAGTGLGSLLFVPLVTQLIDKLGWRGAYVVLGLICLLILAPLLALILRKPPSSEAKEGKINSVRGNWELLTRNPLFWVLLLVSLMALGPLRSLTVHQVAYIESVGIERQTAANYVGLAGFLTAGTFIGWGIISDKFGRATAFTLGALCLLGAVGCLILLRQNPSTMLLLSYAVLLALGEGTRSSQTTALASDIFQDNGLGLVNGIVGAMFGFGAAFGPWIVGRLRDSTGSYLPGFAIIAAMIIFSIMGVLVLAFSRRR